MSWLHERLVSFGEKPALIVADRVCTYADLVKRADELGKLAAGAGVKSGDVMAIPGDHSPDTVAMLSSCIAGGLIAVPMTGVTSEEAGARRRLANVSWIFEDGRIVRAEESAAKLSPLLEKLKTSGRAGLVLFSSGTSGEPKAMVHDLDALVDSYRDRRAKSLSLVLFLLFDHIGGLNTLFNGLACGATLVVPASRSPEAVAAAVEKWRPAVLPASPTFLNLLLVSGCAMRFDLTSLRIITYGTEPMPESLLHRLRRTFPTAKFIQTFGTSETGIARTVSKSSDSLAMRFDDPSLEWKIVDGELWLRSATRALGYIGGDSARFTEDGWFRTGDAVTADAEGYLTIAGRLTERINVGGEKVMPAEIESVVMEVSGVLDVLAKGEPNSLTGQTVRVDVVPEAPGGSDELKRAIRAHCRSVLAPYKVPARVVFTDALETGGRFKKTRRTES